VTTLEIVIKACGGIGVFLLGMITMTEGLRQLAGPALNRILVSSTNSPLSGAMTGAASTAILQSSSATTVAAVGFVSAGLLTFPQALGVIFGANLGTTITGWMVALLGFKLHLDELMMPLILVGVVLKLFSSSWVGKAGYSLAGFGLIFVGISLLQEGMAGTTNLISPEYFPEDDWLGRLKLVGLGVLATIITQSSSAGVAATLAALFAGAINFPQAAALVIGMDVGTTVTAAIATIGGSTAARRTGFSHVIYNFFTAVAALLLITPFILFWESVNSNFLHENAEIGLVMFHSMFNLLGVLAVLPVAHHFAHLIQKIFPDTQSSLQESLDPSLRKEPSLALMAVQPAIEATYAQLLDHVLHFFTNGDVKDKRARPSVGLGQLQKDLDAIHQYLDDIELEKQNKRESMQLRSLFHSLDHMQRLHERCDEDADRASNAERREELKVMLEPILARLNQIIELTKIREFADSGRLADENLAIAEAQAGQARDNVMLDLTSGKVNVEYATESLEAIRWLRRVCRHISRTALHLTEVVEAPKK